MNVDDGVFLLIFYDLDCIGIILKGVCMGGLIILLWSIDSDDFELGSH